MRGSLTTKNIEVSFTKSCIFGSRLSDYLKKMVPELNPEAYQLWLQHVFVFQTKNIQSNLEGRILNPYISHYKESMLCTTKCFRFF